MFNAANEVLVAAFHSQRCGFLAIVDIAEQVLGRWLATEHDAAGEPRDIADVEQAQGWARRAVLDLLD